MLSEKNPIVPECLRDSSGGFRSIFGFCIRLAIFTVATSQRWKSRDRRKPNHLRPFDVVQLAAKLHSCDITRFERTRSSYWSLTNWPLMIPARNFAMYTSR